MSGVRTISILGSTGSIGTSALSVVAHANVQSSDPVFAIDTLAGGRNADLLIEQAREFEPQCVVIADQSKLELVRDALSGLDIEVSAGSDAVDDAARRPVDRVLAAIVGISGLPSTLAAVDAGNSVALANKESMVCAGPLLKRIAAERSTEIVPTDSEHNAMFQVMERREDVERIILTASGGPFRTATREDLKTVTPRRALAHPRWDMGEKISIDSATLFNKGLELIEACYLFDLPEDQIEVVVHPQSILHSAVAYRDGSVLAQMGVPDMRTPISHALTWPERRESTPVDRLDLVALSQLDFEPLDASKFPAVDLARRAINLAKGAPIVLNCANEGAVAAFLAGQCGFLDISWIVETVMERFLTGSMSCEDCENLEAILAIQSEAERLTGALLDEVKSQKQERTA
ncbi:MAG: 1-deoxy-D-xylulose-5-phosphate reductoisomerase [Henriciella sp.]|nr:1-deoxy-D-xylulose-5-phosphate reductoisomerase [Henriciella sp.]